MKSGQKAEIGFLSTLIPCLEEGSEADARHLQQIVGHRHDPKLGTHLVQSPQREPAERPIALDVTRHALYLNLAASIDRGFFVILKGCMSFRLWFFPHRIPVHLAIAFCCGTGGLQRTIAAILSFIDLEALLQSRLRLLRLVLLITHIPTIGAYETIFPFVIRPIGCMPDVLLVASGLFFHAGGIRDEKIEMSIFHRIQVVFLTAISRICNHRLRHGRRRRRQLLHMGDEAARIRRSLMETVRQEELVLSRHLHVVSRL